MRKMILLTAIILIVSSISPVLADSNWSTTWTFNFEEQAIPESNFQSENTYESQNGWWNSDWNYFKTATITNKRDDYQTKLVVGNSTGGDVHCEGHAKSDFGDIRFVNLANDTEYPYWMENYTADTQATFWINNSDNASTILIYYGNSETSTTSNGSNTFLYFDNWTVDHTGDWWSFRETAGGGDDTANNVLNITGGVGYNTRLRYRHTMKYWNTVGTGASFRVGYCSNEWDATYQYPDDWIGTLTTAGSGDGSSATAQAWTVYHDVNGVTGNTGYEITDPFSTSAYYVWDYTLLSDNATTKRYDDNGNLLESSSELDVGDIPPANDLDNIVMFTYVDKGAGYFEHDAVNGELIVGGNRTTTADVFSIDWMFRSLYTATEPSWLSFGSEQSQAVLTPTVTTNSATGVEETNATLSGTLTNNGSADTTCYFLYGDENPPTDNNVSQGIVANGAAFTYNWQSLTQGKLYFTNTQANNSAGWDTSGGIIAFLTKPNAPTSLVNSSITDGINLSWTHGTGYNHSVLVRKTTGYPTSPTDGTEVYNGTHNYY